MAKLFAWKRVCVCACVCVCVWVCVWVCVCVCVCSEVRALPSLLSSAEAEIFPSLWSPRHSPTPTSTRSVFISFSPALPLDVHADSPTEFTDDLLRITVDFFYLFIISFIFRGVFFCNVLSNRNKHQPESASFLTGMWFVQSYKPLYGMNWTFPIITQ